MMKNSGKLFPPVSCLFIFDVCVCYIVTLVGQPVIRTLVEGRGLHPLSLHPQALLCHSYGGPSCSQTHSNLEVHPESGFPAWKAGLGSRAAICSKVQLHEQHIPAAFHKAKSRVRLEATGRSHSQLVAPSMTAI